MLFLEGDIVMLISCSVWSWVTANAAAISAIAAVIAVFVAIWSLHTNRRFEAAKIRPIIAIEIMNVSNFYNLVVRNDGLTAAFDVKIKVSPSIKINLDSVVSGDIPFIKYPIPHLQSGGELKCAFIVGYENLKKISNELRFSFEVEYQDRFGKKFHETQKVDVRLIADAAVLKETDLKDVMTELTKIEKAVQKVAERS